jgi:hypothetical protein
MLQFALEEWVAICEALATGKQAILIRSADEAGVPFELQSTSFWLKATSDSQQPRNVKLLWAKFGEFRRVSDQLTMRYFAKVTGVYEVHKLFAALLLHDFHMWSEAAIRARFAAGPRGLYVVLVRVYKTPAPVSIPATEIPPADHGWIRLPRELPTEGAKPVLDDQAFARIVESLEAILNPTARA